MAKADAKREERLKAALRANLVRRKERSREPEPTPELDAQGDEANQYRVDGH